MSKFCIKCGQKLADESLFCSSCGFKQVSVPLETSPTDEEPEIIIQQPKYQPTKKPVNKEKIINIVKQSIITLLSFITFICSFLPVLTFSTKVEGEKFNINLSPLDNIIFTIDTFSSLSQTEISRSDLYAEFENLSEDISYLLDRNGYEVDGETERLINKAFKIYLRLSFMSEDVEPTLILIIAGIVSACYVILSAIFLLLSALKLLSVLNVTQKERKSTFKFIPIISSVFATILASNKLLYNVNDLSYIGEADIKTTLGSGAILVIIFTALLFISFGIIKYVFEKAKKPQNLISRIIVTAISTFLITSLLSPVFTANILSNFENTQYIRSVKVDLEPTIYNNVTIKEHEEDEIKELISLTKGEKIEYFNDLFDSFSYFTSREVIEGKANGIITTIIYSSIKSKTTPIIHFTFSLAPLFIVLGVLFSVFIITTNLSHFINEKNNKKLEITSKILALLFTACYFAINLIFIIMVNAILSTYLSLDFSLSLTAGSIIALALSIVLVCINQKKRKITY